MHHHQRRYLLVQGYKIADLLIMVGSFLAIIGSYAVTQNWSLPALIAERISLRNVLMLLGLGAAWNLTLTACGAYRSHRLTSLRTELLDVLKATSLASLVILFIVTTFEVGLVSSSRFFALQFWIVSTTLTLTFRFALRAFLSRVRLEGRNLRNILIVGTNERAQAFATSIRERREAGYRVIGFVDRDWTGIADLIANGENVVSDFDHLAEFLRQNVVDEVVMALPVGSYYPDGVHVIRLCEDHGITVRCMAGVFFDLKIDQTRVEMFQEHPVMTLHFGAMEGWPMLVKRAFDFTTALALLIALAPLLLVVSALVRLTSKGPIFFVQDRLGLSKRTFPLYKFRTMVQDAEAQIDQLEALNETNGPTFKITNDPRITRFGKFLRKTSIDELPQLLNILRGEMSLVGPRPLPMRDYEGFSQDWHRRRFSVKPGLTCLWQISGRNNIPFEKWMDLDMQYIDRWSLWLDFTILARTVPVVLRGTGAA